jgi:hypothetical protein
LRVCLPGQKLPGEFARFDLGQDLRHLLPHPLVDQSRPTRQSAVGGRAADQPPHPIDPVPVQEIGDQLQLADTLEVGVLGAVPPRGQGREGRLQELDDPAAENACSPN